MFAPDEDYDSGVLVQRHPDQFRGFVDIVGTLGPSDAEQLLVLIEETRLPTYNLELPPGLMPPEGWQSVFEAADAKLREENGQLYIHVPRGDGPLQRAFEEWGPPPELLRVELVWIGEDPSGEHLPSQT